MPKEPTLKRIILASLWVQFISFHWFSCSRFWQDFIYNHGTKSLTVYYVYKCKYVIILYCSILLLCANLDFSNTSSSACRFGWYSIFFSFLQICTACFGLTGHLQEKSSSYKVGLNKITATAVGSFLSWYYAAAMQVSGFMVSLVDFFLFWCVAALNVFILLYQMLTVGARQAWIRTKLLIDRKMKLKSCSIISILVIIY